MCTSPWDNREGALKERCHFSKPTEPKNANSLERSFLVRRQNLRDVTLEQGYRGKCFVLFCLVTVLFVLTESGLKPRGLSGVSDSQVYVSIRF